MVVGTLLVASLLGAQAIPAGEPGPIVKVLGVRPERHEVKPGETFKVFFDLEIPETWHIYPAGREPLFGKPTVFKFEGAEAAGAIGEPKPRHHKDKFVEYDYHEGRVTIVVPVRLKPGPKPGPIEVKGHIDYQMCDPNECRDHRTPFQVRLTVLEGTVDAAPLLIPSAARSDEYARYGFWGLILLGVLGGLISLVMPCTYPLIPITVTYFVKQAAGSRSHGLALSSAYALGIIVTFTGLGFGLSVALGEGGAQKFAANPWVNLGVGGLFLWFTGSLFGWYEIQLPLWLGPGLAGTQRRGVGGAFLLGLLFSIVTFTCTIPIAATILTLAAGQHRFSALMAMLSYSTTMAVPFFLLGLFPGMIKEVPKSGGWLHTVKVSMAWVELCLAIAYFAKADQVWALGVLPRWLVVGSWVVACAVVAAYMLRVFRARPSIARVVSALIFLGFGTYMGAVGFTGKSLGGLEILIPQPTVEGTTFPKALEEAKRLNKPLFVEFTGVT